MCVFCRHSLFSSVTLASLDLFSPIMAISKRVQTQLSQVVPSEPSSSRGGRHQHDSDSAPITTSASSILEPVAPQIPSSHQNTSSNSTTDSSIGRAWTAAEHERFVQALQLFPSGPWKAIAAVVGTKTARQTMSHAQKCRQKQNRWQRGLKIQSRRSVVGHQTVTSDNSSGNDGLPPVEEVRCNATQDDRFSVHSTLIIEDRPVKSHVTSGGDATSLTQYWDGAHARAQHQHHHSSAASYSTMEAVPVFAVFGAFEAMDGMWLAPLSSAITSSSSGVSSMGLPAAADREDLLRLFQPNTN